MAQVYVRWYGNILQGELLDGEYLGMKQVRIPLDGHHPVALFTSDHVYESAEQIAENVPKLTENVPKVEMIHLSEVAYWGTDVLSADDRETIEAFKRDNWDQEHNHLRIDKLDEFYQFWREAMRPFGFVEAEAVHESCTPSQQPQPNKPAAITKGYPETTQPYPKKTKKPQIVELSLFD